MILLVGWGQIEGGSIFVFPILFGAIKRPLYTPCVLWCAPFGDFIQYALTYIKKKKPNLNMQKIYTKSRINQINSMKSRIIIGSQQPYCHNSWSSLFIALSHMTSAVLFFLPPLFFHKFIHFYDSSNILVLLIILISLFQLIWFYYHLFHDLSTIRTLLWLSCITFSWYAHVN